MGWLGGTHRWEVFPPRQSSAAMGVAVQRPPGKGQRDQFVPQSH